MAVWLQLLLRDTRLTTIPDQRRGSSLYIRTPVSYFIRYNLTWSRDVYTALQTKISPCQNRLNPWVRKTSTKPRNPNTETHSSNVCPFFLFEPYHYTCTIINFRLFKWPMTPEERVEHAQKLKFQFILRFFEFSSFMK